MTCISPEYDHVKALSQDREFTGVGTTPLELQGLCDSTAMCFICRNGSMDKGYQLALCTSLMSQLFGWLQHCFHITAT